MTEKAFETLYVIPTGCPYELQMVASGAWGAHGAIRQGAMELLVPLKRKPRELEIKIREKLYLSWTCAGCTKGLGNEEPDCPQRRSKLGGRPLVKSEDNHA
jgi:hypothetical protein